MKYYILAIALICTSNNVFSQDLTSLKHKVDSLIIETNKIRHTYNKLKEDIERYYSEETILRNEINYIVYERKQSESFKTKIKARRATVKIRFKDETIILKKNKEVRIFRDYHADGWRVDLDYNVTGLVKLEDIIVTDEMAEFRIAEEAKLEKLISSYGDSDGRDLFRRLVYRGMTKQMILDSRGEPDEILSIVTGGERWMYNDVLVEIVFQDSEVINDFSFYIPVLY